MPELREAMGISEKGLGGWGHYPIGAACKCRRTCCGGERGKSNLKPKNHAKKTSKIQVRGLEKINLRAPLLGQNTRRAFSRRSTAGTECGVGRTQRGGCSGRSQPLIRPGSDLCTKGGAVIVSLAEITPPAGFLRLSAEDISRLQRVPGQKSFGAKPSAPFDLQSGDP